MLVKTHAMLKGDKGKSKSTISGDGRKERQQTGDNDFI